jgi:UDP-2,3-diacylglucosamine pyrophosphatase LpxH
VPPKTIVISDIHMSNGAGYSWFLPPYPAELTAMLNRTGNDSSVEELVLLGDVFDLWLYPLDATPWTVSQILAANRPVTKALRQCVRKIPNVYYMNGNHDMKVVPSDLQPLSSGGKNIQMVTPDWYNAKYQNQRHLEHGHGWICSMRRIAPVTPLAVIP